MRLSLILGWFPGTVHRAIVILVIRVSLAHRCFDLRLALRAGVDRGLFGDRNGLADGQCTNRAIVSPFRRIPVISASPLCASLCSVPSVLACPPRQIDGPSSRLGFGLRCSHTTFAQTLPYAFLNILSELPSITRLRPFLGFPRGLHNI